MFQVSVVIPVYNAEAYLRQAVESAISVEEVGEIILIEDRSPDNALQICYELSKKYKIVKIYRHPNGENRGAGASRNLGIEKASLPYIAFLDADDYYLENRFKACKEVFKTILEVDYVVGVSQFEDEYIKQTDNYKMMSEVANNKTYNLFPALLSGQYGYFDTNSIVIKRDSILKLEKWFNPDLKLHQDSEFWLRIAFKLKGRVENKITPGSVVRQHENNRITGKNTQSLFLFWDTLYSELAEQNGLTTIQKKYLHAGKEYYYNKLLGNAFKSRFYKIYMKILYKILIK